MTSFGPCKGVSLEERESLCERGSPSQGKEGVTLSAIFVEGVSDLRTPRSDWAL